jgi:hypothetical protein
MDLERCDHTIDEACQQELDLNINAKEMLSLRWNTYLYMLRKIPFEKRITSFTAEMLREVRSIPLGLYPFLLERIGHKPGLVFQFLKRKEIPEHVVVSSKKESSLIIEYHCNDDVSSILNH